MNSFGIFGAIGFFAVLETALRLATYAAVIYTCAKGVQALNIYINKNVK